MSAAAFEFQICYLLGFAPWDRPEIPAAVQALAAGPDSVAPGRALDLGCGRGNHAIFLAQHGWRVTGVDLIARALHTARRRAGGCGVALDLVQGDATRLETTPVRGPYDLLLDCGCFHYLEPADRARYAAGLARVATPDATLLLFSFLPVSFGFQRWGGPRGAEPDAVTAAFAGDWTLRARRRDDTMGGRRRRAAGYWYRLTRGLAGALTAALLLLPPAAAAANRDPAAAAAEDAAELKTLMAALAARPASNAHFVENRFLAMLKEPLKSSGRLTYVAPDKLEKQTLTPRPQRLAVDGDRVVLDPGPDGGPARTVSLAQQPEVGAFVEAVRGTLAGDLPGLERYYTVSLEGTLAGWTLRLAPKDAGVRKLLAAIRVAGKGREIQTLEFLQTDGDRTEMLIFEDPG